tara:strand:- start:23168 stop:24568 length:1401 start_codon:yes stop_codon:yes gene_type:complete
MNIHIKACLAAIVFSLLFYSKSIGLNLFLISIIVVLLLTSLRKRNKTFWGFGLVYIFTALMVIADPTPFKICTHLMSFLVLIGKTISEKSSLYISWFVGLVNMVIASIFHLNGYLKNPMPDKKKLSPKIINSIKGVVLAIVLILFFSILYRNANPVFDNFVSLINIDFISIPWIFFTLIGYFIFLHILRPYTPEKLIKLDISQKNTLKAPKETFLFQNQLLLEGEHTLGSIVFMALNTLLIVFLITDIIYLFNTDVVTNASYSKSVHQGIYALLFSIICAIIIILYFFRSDLNFFKGNKRIKRLAYLWIILNMILVFFTWYKNYLYVEALGLTYKRIGVFVYLLLTITGLCTTYLKVAQIKSFIYLVRTNIATLFTFLLLSTTIPWDRAITSYNLLNIKNPDIQYLINLGDSNSVLLHKYTFTQNKYLKKDQVKYINQKYTDFIKEQTEKTWQEFTFYQLTNSLKK